MIGWRLDDGTEIIYGEAVDNSHTLRIVREPNGGLTVEDVTDAIHNVAPGDPRTYMVH